MSRWNLLEGGEGGGGWGGMGGVYIVCRYCIVDIKMLYMTELPRRLHIFTYSHIPPTSESSPSSAL